MPVDYTYQRVVNLLRERGIGKADAELIASAVLDLISALSASSRSR